MTAIKGIGPETASAVCQFFSQRENQDIIRQVIDSGVTIFNDMASRSLPSDNPFTGKRIVLTGTLKTMARNEVKRRLETLGASVTSSVSSKTDFLIAGEKAGSKLEKAKKTGVKILEETRLNDLFTQYL